MECFECKYFEYEETWDGEEERREKFTGLPSV